MPRNVLTLRQHGRAIRDAVKEQERSEQARAAKRLVILIHGYQTSEREAQEAYDIFQREVGRTLTNRNSTRFGAVWELHWPGSHPLGLISKATYPTRAGIAIIAGERLARTWLAKPALHHKQVVIVAHSLGCRVALEAVKTIRIMKEEEKDYRGADVEAVFLLAAAVPVSLCEKTGENTAFPAPLPNCGEHVFPSRSDWVLRFLFRPGQVALTEYGPAVGRLGRPDGRWSSPAWDTALGHSDYWGAKHVATRICGLLGITDRVELEAVRSPDFQPFDEPHTLIESHLPEAQLNEHHL